MNIASITVFCNELFRLDNWINYYNEYKDSIALHVIVNNGFEEDSTILKEKFPDSIVLNTSKNNLVHAYNIGMIYILKNKNIVHFANTFAALREKKCDKIRY